MKVDRPNLSTDPEADWFDTPSAGETPSALGSQKPWEKINGLLIALIGGVAVTGLLLDPGADGDKPDGGDQIQTILTANMVPPAVPKKKPQPPTPPRAEAPKTPPKAEPKTTQTKPSPPAPPPVSLVKSADEAVALGRKATAARAYALAAQRYAQALRMAPDRQTLHVLYAQALIRSKRPQEAVAILNNALKTWPKYYSATHLLVRAYDATGDTAKAAATLEHYIKLEGADSHGHQDFVAEGLRLLKAKNAEGAAAWFRRAASLAPKDLRIRYLWAKALFLIKSYSESAALAKSILTQEPDELNAIYLAGRATLEAGDAGSAKRHFTRYLELAPKGKRAKRVKKLLKGL